MFSLYSTAHAASHSNTHSNTKLSNAIATRINQVTANNNIPAISVGVIKNATPYFYSTGLTHRNSEVGVTENTPFQIASLSKMLTGLIANQLIHEKSLDPALPLSHYLAGTLSEDANRRFEQISLSDILHHHSGITDDVCSVYRLRVENEPWLKGYSRDQLIADLQQLADVQSKAEGFQYSSCGYAIVALVSEVVSGQKYPELLQNLVANFSSIENTTATFSAEVKARLAQPYKKTDRLAETQPSIMGIASAASTLVSSAADLLALQTEQIKAYQEYATSKQSSALILTENTAAGPEDYIRYGYGLMEIQHPMGTLYGHDGDADGYASFYVFLPSQDTGVVLLTSSGGDWVAELALELMEIATKH